MSSSDSRPNVLWLMTDQHCFRALGCAGHPDVKTPNIDRLAREGVQFTDAYCPSPVCGPSRGSLFSGHYPENSGVTSNREMFTPAVRGRLLPQLLRDKGYDTALAGKLHFTPINTDHGFSHKQLHDAPYDCYEPEEPWTSDYIRWLAEKHYGGNMHEPIDLATADEVAFRTDDMRRFLLGTDWRTDEQHSNTWVTDRSVEYLREHREDPFFLFASYFGPHQPMLAPDEWANMYAPHEISLPQEFHNSLDDKPVARGSEGGAAGHFQRYGWSEEQYREVLSAYYGQVSMIDRGVGRILDTLDDLGIREDTIVVFTADHGDHNGQFGWFFKGTMYEHSVRVPLIVDDPAGASGVDCGHVVNNLGLYETILQRASIASPETSSRSLIPLIENPGCRNWTDETYSALGETDMVVNDDYKLINGHDPEGNEAFELYNRTEQPYDEENLWESPAHYERQQSLLDSLDEHRKQIAGLV